MLVDTDSLTTLSAADRELSATESAAAATAIGTGVRVSNGALSQAPDDESLDSALEVCKRAGKASGPIKTSFFFDASPTAFGAHQPVQSACADHSAAADRDPSRRADGQRWRRPAPSP